MTIGLIGKKVGMTRVFDDSGRSTPVTVVEVEPNRVTRLRSNDRDGYSAIQVTTGSRRPGRIPKPLKGEFASAGVEPGRGLWEFRVDAETAGNYQPGAELTVALFQAGQKVDVRGTTIGRGFGGVVRRYGFGGGRASHGASLSHRTPGSIGQNQSPGRVFPGKRMAGHMGAVKRVQQNLEIVRVDAERNLLLIKGSVPGPRGFDLIIQPAIKTRAAAG